MKDGRDQDPLSTYQKQAHPAYLFPDWASKLVYQSIAIDSVFPSLGRIRDCHCPRGQDSCIDDDVRGIHRQLSSSQSVDSWVSGNLE